MPGSAVSKLRDRWREKRSKNRRAASPVLPVSQFTEGQSPQQGDVEHQPKTRFHQAQEREQEAIISQPQQGFCLYTPL
ncbi:hypothetical protein VTI28DRAFT_499 [Corynascus sepedonium]